jgi:hypothetical protein
MKTVPENTPATHADLSGRARGLLDDTAVDRPGRRRVGCFGVDTRDGVRPATTDEVPRA